MSEKNIFHVFFTTEQEVTQAVHLGPWCVENQLVVFIQWSAYMMDKPPDADFNLTYYWMQIHDFQLETYTINVAKCLLP